MCGCLHRPATRTVTLAGAPWQTLPKAMNQCARSGRQETRQSPSFEMLPFASLYLAASSDSRLCPLVWQLTDSQAPPSQHAFLATSAVLLLCPVVRVACCLLPALISARAPPQNSRLRKPLQSPSSDVLSLASLYPAASSDRRSRASATSSRPTPQACSTARPADESAAQSWVATNN